MNPHIYPVTIYYEDTDITGFVYHANYFKYFERARSDFLGGERLRQMHFEDSVGVVVYKADIIFKRGAKMGDKLNIHTIASVAGEYRVVFKQKCIRASDQVLLNEVTIEIVCIANEKLTQMPAWIVEKIESMN